jgi:transcription initiation factor IIF auxiliary subunit
MDGLPLRRWSIEIFMLNDQGEEIPASLFDRVTYTLHPSFGNRAMQSMFGCLLICVCRSAL